MSESIFNADQAPVTPVVENPPLQDSLPPEVADLVGEGKKYKSAADALKSIPHAQAHIQKLEEEAKMLREEALKAKAMEDLLEEIKKTGQGTIPAAPQVQPQATPVDIDSKVEQILAKKQAEAIAQQNAQVVIKTFEQTFGKEAEERFIKLADEVGIPLAKLNELSMTSPDAVLKLAGLKKSQAVAKPHSSINTEGVGLQQPQELSAKVPLVGATTKDLVNAWKAAGEKVKQRNA